MAHIWFMKTGPNEKGDANIQHAQQLHVLLFSTFLICQFGRGSLLLPISIHLHCFMYTWSTNHWSSSSRLQPFIVHKNTSWYSLLVERWTAIKRLQASPCRSNCRIFFSRLNFLFSYSVTTVTHKRPRSLSQKCSQQVTPKHAYNLDPADLEWSDYAVLA